MLHSLCENISQKLHMAGYLSEDETPWLRYHLEKKISTVLISIPFLIFGMFLTSFPIMLCFYISFCCLRSTTNGLHAKTMLRCTLASILLEYIFLGILYPILKTLTLVFILVPSGVIIFFLAPYNSPNMNYTDEEMDICSHKSKMHFLLLLGISVIALVFQELEIFKAIVLGVAMTALLLALAYILNGGKNNEKN